MEKFSGKKIYSGVAIGKILYYTKAQSQVTRKKIENTEHEIERYNTAKEKAVEELNQLYEKAIDDVGKVNAQIFEMHAMMLEDDDYNDSVYNMIRTQFVNAEYAVAVTGDNFSKMFENMEDEYFQARSIDIKDISERVISILSGFGTSVKISDDPVIVVAEDLAPSETVQMDKNKLLSFVTRLGSTNSHTAILARMMSIPALINVDIKEEWNGQMAIVDGYQGELILAPDEETIEKYREIQKNDKEKRVLLETLKGKEDVTQGGRKINLYANIGNATDLAMVLQ
ncbi:MAG: phosphoenolpyruvate--protein phosphotransferase, partial [Clostridiales bacterium]|nr:phosphoenolpyruvate--protein phosphotransferase [Clostridiales bacterium]